MRSTRAALVLACALLGLSACGDRDEPTPLPGSLELQLPAQMETGEAVAFKATALQGADLRRRWEFGDGQTSDEASPQHRYAQPGRYTVTLALSNAAGQQVQATRTVQAGAFARLAGRDCSQGAASGWCWQAPSTAARAINDIHFGDARQGVAVGELGHVAITQDGGATWQVQAPPVSDTLKLVCMNGADQAWAVTALTPSLLRSRDGGRSWQVAGKPPMQTVDRLWLAGTDTVVLSGRGPGLSAVTVVSTDAGAHWRNSACIASTVSRDGTLWSEGGRVVSHDLGLSCQSIWTDELTSVLGASLQSDAAVSIVTAHFSLTDGSTAYRVRTSSDGGRRFNISPVTLPDLPAGTGLVELRLEADGRGIGLTGPTAPTTTASTAAANRVLLTSDAGRTWRLPAGGFSPAQRADLRSPGNAYVDEHGVWYRVTDVTPQGQLQGQALVVGADDGTPLVLQVPGENDSPVELRRTSGNAWLAGFGGVTAQRWYSSADAGRSWVALPGAAGPEPDVGSGGLWFFDARQGLWLRSDGVLLATDDGGRSWQQRAVLGSGRGFAQGLQFTPDGTGWVVADNTVYRSTDQGRHWQSTTTPAGGVTQLRFIDNRTAWLSASQCTADGNVVFCQYRLHRTDDAGQSWTALPAEVNESTPMALLDPQRGAWVDAGGTIRYTRDGGKTWSIATTDRPFEQSASTLLFDRQGRGWILPRYDATRVLRSQDGGATWQTVALPVAQGMPFLGDYSALTFGDRQHGWIVGSAGVVLATDDGGSTWRQQASGVARWIDRVFAVDGSTAWIAGGYPATLLTTSTGGN